MFATSDVDFPTARNALLGITVASLLINTLMNSINVNMQVWAEDKTPEASGVIHNTLGLWQECAQVEGAGEVCADISSPAVNSADPDFDDSWAAFNALQGARAFAIIHLVVAVALAGVAGWAWWAFDASARKLHHAVAGLACVEMVAASVTIGCFNSLISSQTSYITVGNVYTTGPGLALMVLCLVGSLISMALAGVALLDLAGLPPSAWAGALRVGSGGDGGEYTVMEGASAPAVGGQDES